jgi:hypothetical protein
MDAARFQDAPTSTLPHASEMRESRIVDAAHFRQLLVSHRRMIRADRRSEAMRGLEDLDTGEVFLTDESRLLNPRRELFSLSN